ncbi:hypothetical protein FisN_40Lh007 [Fistulifera solaris]|uniref:Uncharacterized protein n=1 Tax=Fistulifera solaris TaxID=1519565 RepID=A0A1Z5J970_FISSO|nr:hypothetical protein FisN_40Lh007 [Fistulifera solaris]|eukprot:GAX10540.1 hypothetical protein FisN_40Lh007 [Fistulifera solaris]
MPPASWNRREKARVHGTTFSISPPIFTMMTMTKLTVESVSSPKTAPSVRRASNSKLSEFLKQKWGSREDLSKTSSSVTDGASVTTAASTNASFVPRTSIMKSSEAGPVNSNPDRLTALWGAMSDETKSTLMKNLQAQLAVPKRVETEGNSQQPNAQNTFSHTIQKRPSQDSQNEKTDVVGPLPEMKGLARYDSQQRTPSLSNADSMKSLLRRKIAENKLKEADQPQRSSQSLMRMVSKQAALTSSRSHCNFTTKALQRKKSNSGMKKCVSFEENPVQSVKAIEMCESELKNSVWYSDMEYTGMKNSIKQALREQKTGAFEESDSSTLHGLETFIYRRELKEKRKEAIDAVMFEQARQRIKRIPSDPMLLAEAYRSKLGGGGTKSCSNLLTSKLDRPRTHVHRSSSYSVDLAQVGGSMQNAVWGNSETTYETVEMENRKSELTIKLMQSAA